MSDAYQPIYDAVRSRINGGDIGQAVGDAVRQCMDMSYAIPGLIQDIVLQFAEHARPSAVYRPALSIDGDQWCALYGDNLQDGVAGFGDSPADAMLDFDRAWNAKRPESKKDSRADEVLRAHGFPELVIAQATGQKGGA